MNKLKQDRYIKSIFKTDKYINLKIDENINKFIEEKEETINKKSIKIGLNTFAMLAVAASFILVAFVGINIRAKMQGKPNVISSIQALFTKNTKQQEEQIEQEEIQKEETNKEIILPQDDKTINSNVNNVNKNTEKTEEISRWKAEQLIEKKYGRVDANTGVPVEYEYKGIVKLDDNNEYYSYDMKWAYSLSEFDSYLTTIYVSTDGTKIKEGYNPKNNSNTSITPTITESNENTNIPITIPKERTELVSGVFVTFPNVPVNKVTLYDGTQIGSNIIIMDNKGSNISIDNPEYCNKLYHFTSFESIKSYIRDNTEAQIESLIINDQEWLAYRENFDSNTICIRMYTIKNNDNYMIEAYYYKESENEIFKIINSIMIPEG